MFLNIQKVFVNLYVVSIFVCCLAVLANLYLHNLTPNQIRDLKSQGMQMENIRNDKSRIFYIKARNVSILTLMLIFHSQLSSVFRLLIFLCTVAC
jgi:hypothetical protein